MPAEDSLQPRLLSFQSEHDARGIGQVRFAQFAQTGDLDMLNDQVQEPRSPAKLVPLHNLGGGANGKAAQGAQSVARGGKGLQIGNAQYFFPEPKRKPIIPDAKTADEVVTAAVGRQGACQMPRAADAAIWELARAAQTAANRTRGG
jgi:hypothetical protein